MFKIQLVVFSPFRGCSGENIPSQTIVDFNRLELDPQFIRYDSINYLCSDFPSDKSNFLDIQLTEISRAHIAACIIINQWRNNYTPEDQFQSNLREQTTFGVKFFQD